MPKNSRPIYVITFIVTIIVIISVISMTLDTYQSNTNTPKNNDAEKDVIESLDLGAGGSSVHDSLGEWYKDEDNIFICNYSYFANVDRKDKTLTKPVNITIIEDGIIIYRLNRFDITNKYFAKKFEDRFILREGDSFEVTIIVESEEINVSETFELTAIFPRGGSYKSFFVTPNHTSIAELKDKILESSTKRSDDWWLIRDWVEANIRYVKDGDREGDEYERARLYPMNNYWQFPSETLTLEMGDKEDFAVLLCSLYRSAGWSLEEVSIKYNGAHAVVRIFLDHEDDWIYLEITENEIITGEYDDMLGEIGIKWGWGSIHDFNDQWEKITNVM